MDGKLLEVECSACKPSRHLYIEPLSLGLPKRLAVPEVADHLVCKTKAKPLIDESLFHRAPIAAPAPAPAEGGKT
jgi:hypothetical protein